MKTKLAVLAGGASFEREISLRSSEEIVKYLDKKKYDINTIIVPKEKSASWVKKLIEFSPDLVINLLHGGDGENGSVAGLLNCLNIPSIGNGVLSGAICMNKNICKAVLKNSGVPVCEDVFIKKGDSITDFEEKIKELGFPVIVKPNNGGGSIGISVARNIDEAKSLAENIIKIYNDDVLIEKFINGKEVTIVLIQKNNKTEVMPVLDISPKGGFYDYNSKYIDATAEIGFSTLPLFIREMIEDIAKKIFKLFECEGFCYVDLIVKEEQVYFIEVNTIPGFTKHSIIIKTLQSLNMDIGKFLDELIQNEL